MRHLIERLETAMRETASEVVSEAQGNKTFWRIVHKELNPLYTAKKNLDSLYSKAEKGNDFDVEQLDEIIETLKRIRADAKEFSSADKMKGTPFDW